MKTNKTVWLSIIIKSVVAFLVCLIISLLVLASSAAYSLSRNSAGTLTFDGVYVELKNVDDGNLQYDDGNNLVSFNQFALNQSTNYDVQLPYIAAAAQSDAFYARAKIVYTFYDGSDEVLNGVNAATFLSGTFSTYLDFASDWKNDGDYYYYVSDNTAAVASGNLAAIGGSGNAETVDIFAGTNHAAVVTTGTWESNPEGVSKVTIEVVLDWVATANVASWFE
ncbi:MAG: hypothetical protein J5779_03210 [Clostridia bacterium]|nr:hypothetical protein [Clostridia bacterium]